MQKIKKAEIEKMMKHLKIPESEAIEVIKFDRGEVENEVVEQIEEKAKIQTEKRSSLEKVRHLKAKKKTDAEKENIVREIFSLLKEGTNTALPQQITSSKISFMGVSGAYYSVSVTKHKSKPDGYNPLK